MWFFKPAWMSDNKEKALKAVSKETDQAKLTKIFNSAPLFDVRLAAFRKLDYKNSGRLLKSLNDQTILFSLAMVFPTILASDRNYSD
jgi:hypothetical protein